MSNYELTFILRPLEEADLTATNERITTIVQNAGGEIVARNDWGRRRLAYPIRKNNDGYYTTLHITLPGTAVRGLERSLQLTDEVLRYLVVRVETHTLPPPPVEAPTAAVADPQAAPEPEPHAPAPEPARTLPAEAAGVDAAPVAIAEGG